MNCCSSLAWPAPIRTRMRSSFDSVMRSMFVNILRFLLYQSARRSHARSKFYPLCPLCLCGEFLPCVSKPNWSYFTLRGSYEMAVGSYIRHQSPKLRRGFWYLSRENRALRLENRTLGRENRRLRRVFRRCMTARPMKAACRPMI